MKQNNNSVSWKSSIMNTIQFRIKFIRTKKIKKNKVKKQSWLLSMRSMFLCRAIRLSPFANRLAVSIPAHIQFLRCLANYKALRFSSPISMLAHDLVKRMRKKSSISSGKYVSVHLRFEEVYHLLCTLYFLSEMCTFSLLFIYLCSAPKDMVAFSCCVYDGGKSEKLEMDAIREKGWGKKFKSRDRVIEPGLNRVNGRCPMTPLEVSYGI